MYLLDVFWKSIPECAEVFMNFHKFFIFLQDHKKDAELFNLYATVKVFGIFL